MNKVFTVGKGFVSDHLSYPVITDRFEFSTNQIESVLDKYKPDVIINCIGKTGSPNIDWCESNKEITALTNTVLPTMLADVCKKKSIYMIHIGSGCIYFGRSPHTGTNLIEKQYNTIMPNDPAYFYSAFELPDTGWTEEDPANPKSYYSQTKYACDLVLGKMDHVTTLRIRMPISKKNHPRNFLNKILKYKQIIDIPNSVTFMDDLVRCIEWMIEVRKPGIFHVTNPMYKESFGHVINPFRHQLTAKEILDEYKKYVNHDFEVINEQQLDKLTLAKRSNCIINNDKLTNAGFTMTPALVALEEYMKEYVKNI